LLGHAIVDRNKLESVHYMNRQEIKTKLERALHTTITAAEWAFLEGRGLIHEYEITGDWSEFRDGVKDHLKAIRRFHADYLREHAGDLEEAPRENGVDHQPEIPPADLDDRTFDRYLALGALNHLRSGGSAPPRATILGTLLPRGGVDGTIPQWVYVIAAELWVPAEEVARRFRTMQRTLMVDPDPPRTQARAYNVARFVWEVEVAYGERPSWPELCKLWNDYCKRWNDAPVARRFDDWRDFRTYFLRGEKATLPRYKATHEQITEQVREASNRGEAVAFESWASHVLAATVQADTR
jgi:hypothetical protein